MVLWEPFTLLYCSCIELSAPFRGVGKQASQLPLTRVKNIIKSDPDITLASQEATLIISKVCSMPSFVSEVMKKYGRKIVCSARPVTLYIYLIPFPSILCIQTWNSSGTSTSLSVHLFLYYATLAHLYHEVSISRDMGQAFSSIFCCLWSRTLVFCVYSVHTGYWTVCTAFI